MKEQRMNKRSEMSLKKSTLCFVCGQDNPRGMKLCITPDGDHGAKTELVVHEDYRGWADYLHGGVISLVFDELLGWISIFEGRDAVTARLEVRYRKPVPLGTHLVFKGVLEKETRGILEIITKAFTDDGTLVADGKGRMMVINPRP